MQKRLSTLIACIAAVVALLAFAAVPAFAHHKDGHENGADQTSEENFQEADQESSETTAEESTSEEESSTTSDGRESSSFTRAPGSTPDPEPSQAPPSTTGPSTCEDYSDSEGGPYDHNNCDGSAGQHGGDGNGKCAACTGKADDKGPGGQAPGDHNNGYECDHNGGVGKGNPAHSRCPRPPTVSNVCPPGTDLAGLPPGANGCDIPPNELCPAGTDMAGRPPGPDGCNDLVEGRTDNVCPEGTDLAGQDIADLENCVLGTRFTQSGPKPPLGAILPFTGAGGIYSIAAIGLLLIAAGLINLRLRKQV